MDKNFTTQQQNHAEPPTVGLSLNFEQVKVSYAEPLDDKPIQILGW